MNDESLISEFGSSFDIRFPDTSCVKVCDQKGNEIEIPECERCGTSMMQLIGIDSFMWVCFNCHRDDDNG